MTEYYFDVETEGDDPLQDKILTVQYQQLEAGEPREVCQILTEWEWGEKEILRSVMDRGLLEIGWDFVPVGNRLRFDLNFVVERAEHHGLLSWDRGELKYFLFKKPMIDLWPVLVLMNRGRFEGSSITTFTAKREWGTVIRTMYRSGDYAGILEYVEKEREAVLDLYREVQSVLTTLGDRRKERWAEE